MTFNGGICFGIVGTEEVDDEIIIWKGGDIEQLSFVPVYEFGMY